ncbi:MAG: YncE family protein [Steroidobacteraceae bacterium]
MRTSIIAAGFTSLSLVLGTGAAHVKPRPDPLRLVATIALPQVEGRLDHFTADVPGRRLFISALGNHTVEVVDIRSEKALRSVPGVKEPQGECYVAHLSKLFTADGLAGVVRVYRGSDLRPLGQIRLDLGPDAEAYDPATRRLYVGYGGEDAGKNYGEIGIIDAVTDRHVGDIRMSAHPGTLLVARPGRTLFVTVPKTHEISQIDARTGRIVATWKSGAGSPVSLALDRRDGRLFVGTRKPAEVEVFDSGTHRLITRLTSVGLMDGLFYDARHRLIYASGGEGYVAVYRQMSANRYAEIAKVPTGANARTSLWVTQLDRYYVAVPAGGGQGARVLVFQPTPR